MEEMLESCRRVQIDKETRLKLMDLTDGKITFDDSAQNQL